MCKEEYAEPIQLELMEVVVQIEVQAKNLSSTMESAQGRISDQQERGDLGP